MSNILSTLKVKFSSDTSELKKGTEDSKKAINDLSQSGKSAMDDLAGVFGTSIGNISGQFNTFKNTLSSLSTAFKGAAAGSGGFSAALKILKVALISTGIGAIVVALGSLVAYFTSTERGAQKLSVIMSGFGAVFSVITDRASALGEIIVAAFENPKQALKNFGDFLISQVVNRFTALPRIVMTAFDLIKSVFKGDTKAALADFLSATTQLTTGLDKVQQTKIIDYVKDMGSEMAREAKAAMSLKEQLNALEIAERNMRVTTRQREAAVKALNLIVEDTTKKDAERQAAAEKALSLQRSILTEERNLASERVRILKSQQDLSENTAADYEALADAEAKLAEVDARVIEQMTTMNNKLNILNKSIVDKRKAMDEYLKTIDVFEGMNKSAQANMPQVAQIFKANTDAIVADLEKTEEAQARFALQSVEIGTVIAAGMADIAISFSESLGELMAGVGNASNLGDALLASFADMLGNMGKLFIAAGLACFKIGQAFQKALTNPATALLAVAAGAALVAVAAGLKARMSSVASGGSGGSLSSASGGGTVIDTRRSSAALAATTTGTTVEITGTFRQRGSDLVAVVDKENSRKRLTS